MKLLALLLTFAIAGPALAETEALLVCRHTGAVMRACCCAPPARQASEDALETSCCCDLLIFDVAAPGPWSAGKAIDVTAAALAVKSPAAPPSRSLYLFPEIQGFDMAPRSTTDLYLVVRRLLL